MLSSIAGEAPPAEKDERHIFTGQNGTHGEMPHVVALVGASQSAMLLAGNNSYPHYYWILRGIRYTAGRQFRDALDQTGQQGEHLVGSGRLALSASAVAVVLVILTGCSYGSREGSARYVDPRLFTADITHDPAGPGQTNVFLHAKTLDIQRKDDGLVGVGPYRWIDAMAEIRDSDMDLPIVIEIADNSLQHIDAPLLVDECYRFYGNPGAEERVRDPVTGVERWLPAVHAYNFELVAHDGFGGCESP